MKSSNKSNIKFYYSINLKLQKSPKKNSSILLSMIVVILNAQKNRFFQRENNILLLIYFILILKFLFVMNQSKSDFLQNFHVFLTLIVNSKFNCVLNLKLFK